MLIIEKNPARVDMIANELGNVVMRGMADEAATLMEAGANRADVVCAVTGDDEDNLVICQVAKARFNVPRTIARINNPKNEIVFRRLGIDTTVSSTQVILSVIEQEIPAEHRVPLLRLRYADVEVVEAVLDHRSRVIGKPLRELALPPESTIAVVIRQGQPIFPTGQTVLQAGDEILAFTRSKHEAELSRLLWGK